MTQQHIKQLQPWFIDLASKDSVT